ncbi:MAG: DNA topoisomerase IB [Casimicrobiaceae bacterium]
MRNTVSASQIRSNNPFTVRREAGHARRSALPDQLVEETARHVAAAGLRYVRDADSGLTRRRRGSSFVYFDSSGTRIRHAPEIQRINSLAIPPAYIDVWICPDPDGHIQATARDAKGRKQYRYHPRWQAVRSAAKFERLQAVGVALPRIRRRITALLRLPGMPREKVLAALVQLLDLTLIRVGNDEYARLNRSYGLTTLLTRHVEVDGSTMHFEFNGKSGVAHRITLNHRGLARFVSDCLEIPGRELFQYLDDDQQPHSVSAGEVNAFLQSIAGPNFTAKDFRTWGASVLAMAALRKCSEATPAHAKRNIVETVKAVAEKLGNTPSVCRKSYVHPGLLDAYRTDPSSLQQSLRGRFVRGLRRDEAVLLEFLRTFNPADAPAAANASTPLSRVLRLRKRSQTTRNGYWTTGDPNARRIAA